MSKMLSRHEERKLTVQAVAEYELEQRLEIIEQKELDRMFEEYDYQYEHEYWEFIRREEELEAERERDAIMEEAYNDDRYHEYDSYYKWDY